MLSPIETFVVAALEQRRHLSATLLSAYWPLTQGSTWQYRDVDDGKVSTSTETIVPGTEAANGERAFQRVTNDANGRGTSLQNISPTGRVQFHAVRSSEMSMKFHPAIAFPKFARPGEHTTIDGTVDLLSRSVLLKGTYHVDFRILKREQVKVAAGTFSAIKITMTQEVKVAYHKNGHDLVMKLTAIDTEWWAKGVGEVKSMGSSHFETNTDGKRKSEDGVDKSALQSYSIAP